MSVSCFEIWVLNYRNTVGFILKLNTCFFNVMFLQEKIKLYYVSVVLRVSVNFIKFRISLTMLSKMWIKSEKYVEVIKGHLCPILLPDLPTRFPSPLSFFGLSKMNLTLSFTALSSFICSKDDCKISFGIYSA